MSDDKKVTHVNFQYNKMMEQADSASMQFDNDLADLISRAYEDGVPKFMVIALLQIYLSNEAKKAISDSYLSDDD